MNLRPLLGIALLGGGIAAGWLMARAQYRQSPVSPTAESREAVNDPAPEPAPDTFRESPLGTLDWLVGDWADAGNDADVEFNCHFTKNGAFLLRSFRMPGANGVGMSGMQLIAWDAAREAIRSWTYDSQGGFGEETWVQSGNRYTIRSKYTLPDGGTGSNIQVVTFIDTNTFTWKSVDREIDGELQPDTSEIAMVRKIAGNDTKGDE